MHQGCTNVRVAKVLVPLPDIHLVKIKLQNLKLVNLIRFFLTTELYHDSFQSCPFKKNHWPSNIFPMLPTPCRRCIIKLSNTRNTNPLKCSPILCRITTLINLSFLSHLVSMSKRYYLTTFLRAENEKRDELSIIHYPKHILFRNNIFTNFSNE